MSDRETAAEITRRVCAYFGDSALHEMSIGAARVRFGRGGTRVAHLVVNKGIMKVSTDLVTHLSVAEVSDDAIDTVAGTIIILMEAAS